MKPAHERWIVHPQRFAQAERSSEYARALSAPAPPPSLARTVYAPAGFLAFWLALGMPAFVFDADLTFKAFALLVVGGGAVFVARAIQKAWRRAKAPVIRELAVVIDKRARTTASAAEARTVNLPYYATLQLADGRRAEMPTSDIVAGLVARGDIGVAVTRGGDLIDYHRIDG